VSERKGEPVSDGPAPVLYQGAVGGPIKREEEEGEQTAHKLKQDFSRASENKKKLHGVWGEYSVSSTREKEILTGTGKI